MAFRDKNDSGRDFAPLKPAQDSVLVDSTAMTLDETVEKITHLAQALKR